MSSVGRPCPKCGASSVVVAWHWACAICGVEWWDIKDGMTGEDIIEAYRTGKGMVVSRIPDGCLLILGSREVKG